MIPTDRAWCLARATFRTSDAHELVLDDHLNERERAQVRSLSDDPDFYGIVRPVGPDRTRAVKAVNRDTALLLLTLRQPSPIPSYARRGAESSQQLDAIVDLLLDGILEIHHEGVFVSGPGAMRLLDLRAKVEPAHPLAHLSRRALCYAATLEIGDRDRLAWRLYRYGTKPLTTRWRCRWPDADAVRSALGIGRGEHRRQRLHAAWTAWETTPGWLGWTRRQVAIPSATEPRVRASHKLYLSPTPEAIEATFEIVLDQLPATRAHAFKIGSDAAGLLRADKLIAYFPNFDSLLAATARLEPALDGIPAHGVPFTAPIDPQGLMSWGMDPTGHEQGLANQGQESWRLWLVRRLATALITAQAPSEVTMPAWRFATERVRRLGVDVDRWIPSATLWQAG